MWVSGSLAALSFLCRLMPARLALAAGDILGALWWWLLPIRKRLVIHQIHRAFPDLPAHAVRRIARKVGSNLGQNLLEFFRLDPRHPDRLPPIRRENFAEFERAEALGRGVLVLTAHLGNWDLLVCSQSLAGVPITIVSKTIRPEGLNRFWMRTRNACGVTILPDRGVKDRLLETLAKGRVVGFVLDQHAPPKVAVQTRFFDRAAATSRGLAELALESGAPIVPIFLFREPDGSHRMCVWPTLTVETGTNREDAVRVITQRCTEVIEAAVRSHPDQWLWLHRRWKLDKGALPEMPVHNAR